MRNFDHWGRLPKVVCACCTYNREKLLPKAVDCFRGQDYPGEMVLVILNDQKDIKYYTEDPRIFVVNKDERYKTLGEKRNVCCRTVNGDLIIVVDDDDEFFSWRVSMTVERMRNHHFWKGDRVYKKGMNVPKYSSPILTNAPSSAGFSREIFEKVGGYPEWERSEDSELQRKIFEAGYEDVGVLTDKEAYYIYNCFNTGSYHASSQTHAEIQAKVGKTRHIEL